MDIEKHIDAIESITEKYLNAMSEYTDCIHVITSFDNEGETHMYDRGRGNIYGRIGMAQAFIERDKAREHLTIEHNEYK
jgi:hypothetical protein